MTTTVTKESLAARIAELESGARSLKEDYTLAAYKMLLATMGSEPVAYSLIFRSMDGVLNNYINTNTVFATREKAEAYGKGGNYEERSDGGLEWVPNTALDPVVIPLYRHEQPVPVVPEENNIGSKNALDAIVSFIKSKSNPTVKCYEEVSEQLFKDNCHGIHSHVIEYILKLGEELEDLRAEQAEKQPAPVVPDGYVTVPKEPTESMLTASYMFAHVASTRESWAAMLAAAPQLPGSEPATVPGKWIPVSERMPIEFEAVIALDGDQVYGEAMYSSDDGFTIDGYEPWDRVQLQNVTHWMPLPAGPREVK